MIKKLVTKKKLPNCWASIDPGFRTGICIWTKNKYLGVKEISHVNTKTPIQYRIHHLYNCLETLIENYQIELLIIEGVYFWAGSLKSMTAVTRGDLFKLAYIVGSYITLANQHEILTEIYLARDWKGQMNNEAVNIRVHRLIGTLKDSQHINDAIGIGLNYMGLF